MILSQEAVVLCRQLCRQLKGSIKIKIIDLTLLTLELNLSRISLNVARFTMMRGPQAFGRYQDGSPSFVTRYIRGSRYVLTNYYGVTQRH